MLCPFCYDVKKLIQEEERVCKCGKVKGQAVTSDNVRVSEKAVILGLNNYSLLDALTNYHSIGYEAGDNSTVDCWMFKHDYHKVERIGEE